MVETLAQENCGVSLIVQVAIGSGNRRDGLVDEAKGMFSIWKLFFIGY
jgi:hypothetical protein